MPTFGNTGTPPEQINAASQYKAAGICTLSEGGVVSKLSVYLANTDTGHAACVVKGIVYSVTTGAPDARLAVGSDVNIIDNQAAGWVDLPLSSPLSLAAGSYALGIALDTTAAGIILYYTVGGTALYWYRDDAWADGVSDPWGADTGENATLGVYATYQPNITGTGALTVASPAMSGTGHYDITGTGALTVASPAIAGVGHYDITGTGALTVAAPAISGTMWQDSHVHRQLTGTAMLEGIRGKVELYGIKGKVEM